MTDMEKLREYLNSLSRDQQASFAEACGTSVGYLRKAISVGQQLGSDLCIQIDKHSSGRVSCETLRPDVPWDHLRTSAQQLDKRVA